MNFGDCPYEGCDGEFWLSVPDVTPAYAIVVCETCGRDVWYRFSRWDPEAWTIADFEAEFIIDHATKSIRKRNPEPELTQEMKAFVDILVRAVVDDLERKILYGDPTASSVAVDLFEGLLK